MLKAFNLLISFKRFTTFTQAKKMNSKATIVVKPTQSGKTFTMLTKIVDLFRENEETSTRRIQLIFVDNNLLLANQTASRVRDCEWFENDENEYLMFSSNSKTAKAGDIIRNILSPFRDRQVHNIIMCANIYRFRDTIEIIGCTSGIEYDIWIDESDKTFSSANHTTLMKTFCDTPNVKSVTLLTATPSKNLKQFKDGIPIYAMENTTIQDVYSGWRDSNICHHDIDIPDSVSYARSVIDKYSDCFKGEVRCFIPADFYVETHESMASMLREKGFTVLIINGSTCDITFKLGKKEFRRPVLELLAGLNPSKYSISIGLNNISAAEWIGDIYSEFVSGPFAITGNLCINRGTTLSSSKMFINRAIMPPKQPKTKATKEITMTQLYQLAGRICGNTQEYTQWESPLVFCTSLFDSCIQTMETRARRLAEVAFNNNTSIVTSSDYETSAVAPLTASEKKQQIKDNDLVLRGTVPEVLQLTEDELQTLIKLTDGTRESYLIGVIRRLNPNLFKKMEFHMCQSISHVGATIYKDTSLTLEEQLAKIQETDGYRKHIEGPINRNKNNLPWKAAIPKEKNNDDLWVAYIDSIYNRVIISVWNGESIFTLP